VSVKLSIISMLKLLSKACTKEISVFNCSIDLPSSQIKFEALNLILLDILFLNRVWFFFYSKLII
jgi:hypothetical protein